MNSEARVWPIALVLFLTIPLQMGLIDGLAARRGAPGAERIDLRTSLLMQGCGPGLVAGIAAIRRRLAGKAGSEKSERTVLGLATVSYLAYLPIGLVGSSLAYMLASGGYGSRPALSAFCLAALVATVFVTCGTLGAMTGPRTLPVMTLRVVFGFVPLAALDLIVALMRLAGHRQAANLVLLASLAPGMAALYVLGRRR